MVFSWVMVRSRVVLAAALLSFAVSAFAQYSFTHFAGSVGGPSYEDGDGTAARFKFPVGISFDAAGNLYVADSGNYTIRRISPRGAVSTFAGVAEAWGDTDGRLIAARFNNPDGVAVDSAGNVWVADTVNQSVRKISAGVVTTFAGFASPEGLTADASGNVYVAEPGSNVIKRIAPSGQVTPIAGLAGVAGSSDGQGSAARFNGPVGLAADAAGNVFVADAGNHAIRKIAPGGVVTTVAGLAGADGSSDGVGSAARFHAPAAVAVDSAGNLYVADTFNNTIRKIAPGGAVSTLAGNPDSVNDVEPFGAVDGVGSAARFTGPMGIAVDGHGIVYVADTFDHSIRRITPAGEVTTFAGLAAQWGLRDGNGAEARFDRPVDVALDDAGNVYVADEFNHAVRKIAANGAVSTVAGVESGLDFPTSVAVDSAGTAVYVANGGDHTIRKIAGGVATILAGKPGQKGSGDGVGSAARFDTPFGVGVDGAGNVYVADTNNHTIRKITPDGTVTTLAGLAGAAGSSDGTGSAARFYLPTDLVADAAGTLLVADTDNHTVRKITSAGVVTTVAGKAGVSGNTDGSSGSGLLAFPHGIAFGRFGIYVTDGNHEIRRIRGTTVETLAGRSGLTGSTDGLGFEARFNNPGGLAVDRSENLYIADTSNHSIRRTALGGDQANVTPRSGSVGTIRQLYAYPQTSTAWLWEVIVRPPGSTAQPSRPSFADPLFIPDVPGHYVLRLRATSASGVATTTVSFDVTPEPKQRAARH